jgi:hypothetical protein
MALNVLAAYDHRDYKRNDGNVHIAGYALRIGKSTDRVNARARNRTVTGT